MIHPWQIALITLYAFIQPNESRSFKIGMDMPILAGWFTGLLLGNPQTGLVLGGTLQLMTLGVNTYRRHLHSQYHSRSDRRHGAELEFHAGISAGDCDSRRPVNDPTRYSGTLRQYLLPSPGRSFHRTTKLR